jgi:hypothetical protein
VETVAIKERCGKGCESSGGPIGGVYGTAYDRIFYRTPARVHSEKEDEEEGKQGSPRALICGSPASPLSLSPSPHTAQRLHCMGRCYQDTLPPPLHRQKSVIFRESG